MNERQLAPSLDLVRRTLEIEAAYTLARLQVLERIPGNPVGVAYRQFDDGVVALMAKNLPSLSFNSVVGLRTGLAHHIAPLAAWYRESDVNGRFEVVPGYCDADICRELARLGYFQSGFHVSTIALPDVADGQPAGSALEQVTDAAAMEDYLDAYVAGWEIPQAQHRQFKSNVRSWREQPGWSLYLSRIDGRPAASAILFVKGNTAYLADAATDPQLRGRGLQTALLLRRIADAKAAGVDFVCSGAAYLSASHRNMERVGMRIQFVRAIWTAL
jgi:ribosomal protein S18 acetylase RimI-like enzyme